MVGNALIPTTAVDQYGATLGASPTDLATIFPNLAYYSCPNLGFVRVQGTVLPVPSHFRRGGSIAIAIADIDRRRPA